MPSRPKPSSISQKKTKVGPLAIVRIVLSLPLRGPHQQVANGRGGPAAAARRVDATVIQTLGDLTQRGVTGGLDIPDDRQNLGGKLVGRGTVCGMRLDSSLGGARVAELGAGGLLAASAAFVRAEISARSFSARAA
jgi:hypothetical protein